MEVVFRMYYIRGVKLLKILQTTMMICCVTYHHWRYLAQKKPPRDGTLDGLGLVVHFGAFARLGFEVAVNINIYANAYRLCRPMLQSHSRTLFLLFLELAFGFFVAIGQSIFLRKECKVMFYEIGMQGRNRVL